MDSFRKPEMIIAIIAIILIIVLAVFGYKKAGVIGETLNKRQEDWSNAIRRVAESPQMEHLKQLNDKMEQEINKLKKILKLQNKTINQLNIEIEELKQKQQISTKSTEYEEIISMKPKAPPKTKTLPIPPPKPNSKKISDSNNLIDLLYGDEVKEESEEEENKQDDSDEDKSDDDIEQTIKAKRQGKR